ncbi:MAG: DNA-binding protein [Polycyclovorans sp.]|nr:DNA-binding protein [Polycyclovorans sp.]
MTTVETLPVAEARLQSEIDTLRAQYPETQDLYREVCVLLFFRHGMTPTANKLDQLVRKGSMSAPAEALTRFWETLREKSRIRIEHPDLPEPLRDAAGEMVAALWQHAQAAAQEALKHLQEESRASVLAAQGTTQSAIAQAQAADEALSTVNAQLQATQEDLKGALAELAGARGEISALQRQVDAGAVQHRELQETLNASQRRFTEELEQQRKVATATEERHAGEMRRALLDVDRERGNAAKLQKDLDQARRLFIDQTELHRQQMAEKQQQADVLRDRQSELDVSFAELRGQRDLLLRDVEGLKLRLERQPAAKVAKVRPAKAGAAELARGNRSK